MPLSRCCHQALNLNWILMDLGRWSTHLRPVHSQILLLDTKFEKDLARPFETIKAAGTEVPTPQSSSGNFREPSGPPLKRSRLQPRSFLTLKIQSVDFTQISDQKCRANLMKKWLFFSKLKKVFQQSIAPLLLTNFRRLAAAKFPCQLAQIVSSASNAAAPNRFSSKPMQTKVDEPHVLASLKRPLRPSPCDHTRIPIY